MTEADHHAKACSSGVIQLTPAPESSSLRQEVFALYRQSLYAPVEKAFGWDESAQRLRFDTAYRDQNFFQILLGAEVVGYVVIKPGMDNAHLSLLLITPEHQHRGIGRHVMKTLMCQADEARRALTLSCFVSEDRVMGFYQRLGFKLECRDEHFAAYRYSAA